MTHPRHPSFAGCRLARRALTLMLVLFLTAPWLVSAQDATTPVEVYRSPEFGYLTWWDASVWSLAGQDAQAGSELLQFMSDEVGVAIWGYAEPDASAHSCAEAAMTAIGEDDDFVRYEAIYPAGAQPEVHASEDDRYASVGLVIVFNSPDGRYAVVDEETCDAIGPDHILATSQWMLVDTFNARYGQFGETPASTVTLPRSAWTFNPGESTPIETTYFAFGAPSLLVDPDTGEERGLLTYRGPNCIYGARAPTVVAENTGPTTWTLALGDFSIEDDDGTFLDPAAHWLWPPVDSRNAVVLNPGDVAILEFGDALNYLTTFGDAVFLTPWGTRFPIGTVGIGGCGGGGAPVLIDLEE